MIPAAARWSDADLDRLARQHRVLPGDVAHAAARGVDSVDEAARTVRERSRGRLEDLATRLDCPFGWDDLVLAKPILDLLRDFTFEAQERARVWEAPALRRLFALLTGLPGTGKTMAAQAIAAELSLDLYRISLATVISKYVGETAKNLERILARAETMDAVLLFDEADALFGKRTEIKDAHDRYANSDTNHLLQAIESYSGIAILASNKKGNVDPAFVRRLRYVVELPRPDAPQRRALWERLVGELCGAETSAASRALLDAAAAIELTGAQIKFAILAALFAARREGCSVGGPQLVRGLERELFKEGRALSDRERERLLDA
jgi:AAA+ superfamily predicted ATPase